MNKFFLFFLPSTIFAYLDPGTGSLLLSSVVALFASGLFFIRGFLYQIKISLGGGQQRQKYFNKLIPLKNSNNIKTLDSDYGLVIYSEGKHYYNVFKPIIDYFDTINYSYIYFTSSKDDLALHREKNSWSSFEYIGDSNQAYIKLNCLRADIVLMTTPQLDVLQIKRSKGVKHYCHIIHSLPHVDIYEVFALDYFDSVFTNSPIHTNFIHKVESIRNLKTKQVTITGCTYLDVLKDKLNNLNNNTNTSQQSYTKYFNDDKIVVLLSPSWGRESLLHKYGMDIITPFIKSDFNLIIRPHPQTLISDIPLINYLRSKTEMFSNIKWDINTDNIYAMQEASVMVGDFSGVIFDFICLFDKPVVTMKFAFNKVGYDIEDTNEDIWVEKALREISIIVDDVGDIKNVISNAILDSTLKANRATMKELLWKFQGLGGEKTANELLKIHKNILENSLCNHLDTYHGLIKLNGMLKA